MITTVAVRELVLAWAGGVLSAMAPCAWPLLVSCLAVTLNMQASAFPAACCGVSEQNSKRFRSLHVEDSPQLAVGSFNYQSPNPSPTGWRQRLVPDLLIFVVIGFAAYYLLLGLPAWSVGKWAWAFQSSARTVAGLLMLGLGGWVLGLGPVGRGLVWLGLADANVRPGRVMAVLIGVGLAAGWIPCPGQSLTAIIIYGATTGNLAMGAGLLAAHTIGLTSMVFLFGLTGFHMLRPWSGGRWGKPLTAGLLALMGCLTMVGWLHRLVPSVQVMKW